MRVQPYLSFEGRCEEALEFYRSAVGAEVAALMRFSESPDPGMNPPGSENKVMHSSFRIGESELMATDGNCGGGATFSGISLTLTGKDDEETARLFNALADGGKVGMPLEKTFFASSFGMLTDRFGVGWMVITADA